MESSGEWVEAVVKRLHTALPHRPQNMLWTPVSDQLLQQSTDCTVALSDQAFSTVISSLGRTLAELIKSHPPASPSAVESDSYCVVLECIRRCLAKRANTKLGTDEVHELQQLYQMITQLCLLYGEHTDKISAASNAVLYHLSALNFHGIFNKIILRVTSVNRVAPLPTSLSASSVDYCASGQSCVIGLIPHLNLNAARLQQILQVIVTSFKDLKKHKQLFVTIPPILHKSIWNFIQEYPLQFNELLKDGYPSLTRSADKLFNLCDEYADTQKKRIQVWPLQHTLLILCPHIFKDITQSGMDKPSANHKTQRAFITGIVKGLGSSNKLVSESAAVCAVDLFKACSFIRDRSSCFHRYYVSQLQGNVQTLLFSPQAPFLHQATSILVGIPTYTDRELMVTCLVAQFRSNHRNSHIFSVCLDPSSPPGFRLVFVEALYIVLREAAAVEWWPGAPTVYTYAPDLRSIFQTVLPHLRRYDVSAPGLVADITTYMQSPVTSASMLQAKSKAERKQVAEMAANYQLTKGLVTLFSLDPMLAFSYPNEEDAIGECLQFMTGLVGLVQYQSIPNLPLKASKVLLTLHEPDNIELWDKNDPMTAFWDISGQVTYSIVMKLFSRKTSNALQLLQWLKRILHYRTQFLKKHESEANQGSSCKISQQMYTMLETVLLLFLRNTNVEAVHIAMSCFKYLVMEAELVMNPSDPTGVPYAPNLRAYRQLYEASTMLQIGRAAQQKKIRAILKELVHTPGSALAWEDTHSSWKVTKQLLISYQRQRDECQDVARFASESLQRNFMRRVNPPSSQPSNREQQLTDDNISTTLLNWTNMTGFLCSLAGVSTTPLSTYPLLLLSGVANSSNMIDGDLPLPPHHPPSSLPLPPPFPPTPSTTKELFTFNSKVKRSTSLHGNRPKSINVVHPSSRVSNSGVIADSGAGSSYSHEITNMDEDKRTSHTESFISELIHLLSFDKEGVGVKIRETVKEFVSSELSPIVYPYLFECMISESFQMFSACGVDDSYTTLIDQLVSIVQHILETKVDGALEHLAHVKIDNIVLNFVMYADKLEEQERSVAIKIKLSNLIQTVMQRSRDLSLFRHEANFRNQLVEPLTQWVRGDIQSTDYSSHMESLHNELDLCALRAVGQVLSGLVLQPKQVQASTDVIEEKGRLFLKYFKRFMELIHSLNQVEWSKLSDIHKQPLHRHVSSLREYTIQAMSNMLTANIDSGLTQAITLGYHEDLKTRTSFIEVLTSILRQGAEFNSLADTALADRFNIMLELVTTETVDGDFPIMMSLISSVPPEHVDELAEVLVILFDFKNNLAKFLVRIFNTEVEALESGRLDTLFRGNSIACKVLSCSFKMFGVYYLQSVVRPLIQQLMKSNDRDYEVDPTRLADPSKLERNRANLLELVESFYTTILDSLPSLPLQLRTVCHILYSIVTAHFPDSGLDTVNSAIFLRFINPAIVSPQTYNLVQGDVPPGVRRGLTFISKVLQNLANHVLFKKEAHMEVFNLFLDSNFSRSRELALSMACMGPYSEGEAVEYIALLKETYKHRLHALLWANQERVASYAASVRTGVSSRHVFTELNVLLAQLGAPNYRRKRSTTNPRSALVSSQLEEFLDSMANECDEKTLRSIKAKDVFYQGGMSKAGNPVFYFIARKFRGEQLHVSYQLLYHMMTLLKGRSDKAFEMVVDLTQASLANEPDLELLVKFAAYVPELAMSQIEAVYFYSANLAFKQYATKLANSIRIFSHIKGAKKVVMVDNCGRFSDYIDRSELALPSSTMAYEQDGRLEFPNAHFLMFKQVALQIPATLHVCDCGLLTSLVDRIKVFEIPTVLREVLHISDIREVFTEDKTSVAVRVEDGGTLLKFTSPYAEAISKAINAVISKWQNLKPSRYMSERKLEPKDVPGTFLNMALLNLGSPDSGLRVTAYKLLSAVKDAFHLRIDRHLESTHDLCIPANSADFILSISSQLARNEPHLTLEFLSEVIAGFQQHSTPLKQLCLAYLSPWLPNLSRFVSRNDAPSEKEKVIRIIDLLVALTISEEGMYPLIQTHVWAKIGGEPDLLRRVLERFIRMSMLDGLGSRKLEVLADTTVTLEQGSRGVVASEVINKMLKTVAHTSDEVTGCLEEHYLWTELVVLSRFLLALSFSNKINVVKNLTDVFYLCVMMMASGPVFVRATIHGIILNVVQSLANLPAVRANEEALKCVSLKLAEFSSSKVYLQFGLHNPASVSAYDPPSQTSSLARKDSLSSSFIATVTGHFLEIVHSCAGLLSQCKWLSRWQKLAKRTSFYYNPALQSRSFLMLGVISHRASASIVNRTLSVLEGTLAKHGNDIALIDAITICLTRLVPLLDEVGENTKLNQHLFWVSVGVLQLGEPTLYASALGLLEACIKVLESISAFEKQSLAEVMQPTRDAMEWPLSQMDRELGISFDSNFHFALAALLYKGFSHPLSTVRTHTQELLTTLYFIHSPPSSRTVIEMNLDNLAYLTALFPESSIMREQLSDRRRRLKSLKSIPSSTAGGEMEDCSPTFSTLMSLQSIPGHKEQILFLLMLSSALVQSRDDQKIELLYQFLADASQVYCDVFPLIHCVLVDHLAYTLQQSPSPRILGAVQRLISVAVVRNSSSSLLKPSFISDIGFGGLPMFFRPFPKPLHQGLTYSVPQGMVFQKFLGSLVTELQPSADDSPENTKSLKKLSLSLSSIKDISPPPLPLPRRRSGAGGFSRSASRDGSLAGSLASLGAMSIDEEEMVESTTL